MLPVDRVVPESDGPFAKTASGPIMPWEAANVAGQLGELWGLPPGAADEQLARNGRALRAKLAPKT